MTELTSQRSIFVVTKDGLLERRVANTGLDDGTPTNVEELLGIAMPLVSEPINTLQWQAAAKSVDEDDEDDIEDDVEEDDDWEAGEEGAEGEEEEEWDPDFDEFDLPKSGKKPGKGGDDDDDPKFDEDLNEFDDLFGDSGSDFDDDDDF